MIICMILHVYALCVLNEFEGIIKEYRKYMSIDYFKLLQFVFIYIHVKLSKLKKNPKGF